MADDETVEPAAEQESQEEPSRDEANGTVAEDLVRQSARILQSSRALLRHVDDAIRRSRVVLGEEESKGEEQ